MLAELAKEDAATDDQTWLDYIAYLIKTPCDRTQDELERGKRREEIEKRRREAKTEHDDNVKRHCKAPQLPAK